MRKERVALEHHAEAPVAHGLVDPAGGVVDHPAAHPQHPPIGPGQPGETLQGQAFPRAGGTEQRDHPLLRLPADIQREAGKVLEQLDREHQAGVREPVSRPTKTSRMATTIIVISESWCAAPSRLAWTWS